MILYRVVFPSIRIPPGSPSLIAGVAFVCPGLVKRFGGCFRGRFPALDTRLNEPIRRFQSDLERRHRGSVR
jgi:hypothetical protein